MLFACFQLIHQSRDKDVFGFNIAFYRERKVVKGQQLQGFRFFVVCFNTFLGSVVVMGSVTGIILCTCWTQLTVGK